MRARRRPQRIQWWAWIALLAVGLAAVAAGFGWAFVILVAMAWLSVTLYRLAAPGAAPRREPEPRRMLAQPRGNVDATLGAAPTALLCELWTQTGHDIRRTYLPSTICSYAELRQAILDELTRREPEGVRRWLEEQPDRRDIRSYLHDQQSWRGEV
jgi:hypothetical protein